MPMNHRVFFKQCEEIAKNNKADLIGCITNRIGIKYQQHEGVMSENFDVLHHMKIGEERYKKYGNEVELIPEGPTIGGVMMLFSKKTWRKAGKFPEGKIQIEGKFIDYIFCDAVIEAGLKIAIAKGIYIFHLYRAWVTTSRTKQTRTEYQHLM
jgi:hypothetical protein